MMDELQMWYNGSDTVIAYDEKDAARVWEETTGESWQTYAEDGDTWELRDQHEFELYYSEQDGPLQAPDNATVWTEDGMIHIKASRWAWIKSEGRGWFCSENW